MSDFTLLLFEASGIQDYIFGSNQLAQNIGASEIVSLSTTKWLFEQCIALNLKTNITGWSDENGLELDTESHILEDSSPLDIEVIYAAGGNAMLVLKEQSQAEELTFRLGKQIYEHAYGLKIVSAQKVFSANQKLPEVHKFLRQKLSRKKLSTNLVAPLLGLSVTASCVFTGKPAIGYSDNPLIVGTDYAANVKRRDQEGQRISKEVAHKLRYEEKARSRLKSILPLSLSSGEKLELVYDFDHFGAKGESSYISVIHADGNSIGKRFQKISESAQDNVDYIKRYQALSGSIAENAKAALQETVQYLIDSLQESDGVEKFGGVVHIPEERGSLFLPFRPLVFGGDDVTFVADGRLGLALAAKYIEFFTAKSLADGDDPVFARAGVAIVKTHFPFSRAYELSEQLIGSAKKAIKELSSNGVPDSNFIDWHHSTTGVIHSLETLREREYTDYANRSLLMRPLNLKPAPSAQEWKSWDLFKQMTIHFQKDKEWKQRKNKLHVMKQALRDGDNAFELFIHNYRIKQNSLPEVAGKPGMQSRGRDMDDCAYYDPLEAVDYFVSLD